MAPTASHQANCNNKHLKNTPRSVGINEIEEKRTGKKETRLALTARSTVSNGNCTVPHNTTQTSITALFSLNCVSNFWRASRILPASKEKEAQWKAKEWKGGCFTEKRRIHSRADNTRL
jgi:hypothetical protein